MKTIIQKIYQGTALKAVLVNQTPVERKRVLLVIKQSQSKNVGAQRGRYLIH